MMSKRVAQWVRVSSTLQEDTADVMGFAIHHIKRAKARLGGNLVRVAAAEAEDQIRFTTQRYNDPVAREARESPGVVIDG